MTSDSPNEENADLGLAGFRHSPADQGVSLDQLSAAFADMLGAGHDPYSAAPESPLSSPTTRDVPSRDEDAAELEDRTGDLTPQGILEAMLFVGNPDNAPLTAERVASLMRGVRASEIDQLVVELNRQYDRDQRPYRIRGEGAGYRLTLRDEFAALRDRFHGRVREARLSPAALEALALVAYNQPLTGEDVSRLRGRPSGSILALLVRRQLLRIERPETSPRVGHYFTTPRFLKLFGLESLDDLPRGQEFEAR